MWPGSFNNRQIGLFLFKIKRKNRNQKERALCQRTVSHNCWSVWGGTDCLIPPMYFKGIFWSRGWQKQFLELWFPVVCRAGISVVHLFGDNAPLVYSIHPLHIHCKQDWLQYAWRWNWWSKMWQYHCYIVILQEKTILVFIWLRAINLFLLQEM